MRFDRTILFAIVPTTALLVAFPLREAFELPKTLAMQAAALLLACSFGLRVLRAGGVREGALSRRLRRGPDRTSFGVYALLVSATLSTVFATSPRTAFFGAFDSFFGLCTLGAAGVIACTARESLRSLEEIDRLSQLVAVSAVLVAGSALVQAIGLDPVIWKRTSELDGHTRIFGTLGHPNHLAAFLAMSLPLQIRTIGSARDSRRWFALACGLLSLLPVTLAVVLAQSRAGWAAFGFAFVVTPAFDRIARGDSGGGLRAWRRSLVASCGLALVTGTLLVATPGLRDEAASVLDRARTFADVATNPRREIWRSSVAMLRANPWLGVGIDNFGLTFGRYRTPDLWRLEPHGTPLRAHDEWLHLVSTQGIVGLAALVTLLICVFADARSIWNSGDTRRRRAAAVVLASLAALAVALSTGFLVAATATLAAVELGALAALTRIGRECPGEPARRSPGDSASSAGPPIVCQREVASARAPSFSGVVVRALAAGLVITAAGAFHFGVLQVARAEFAAAKGEALGAAGSVVDAADQFVRAINAAPWIDRHWMLAARAFGVAAAVAPDLAEHTMLLDAAQRSAASAVALEPANPYAHSLLARALAGLAAERPPRAREAEVAAAYERGLMLDPLNLDLLRDAEQTARSIGAAQWADSLAGRLRALEP